MKYDVFVGYYVQMNPDLVCMKLTFNDYEDEKVYILFRNQLMIHIVMHMLINILYKINISQFIIKSQGLNMMNRMKFIKKIIK